MWRYVRLHEGLREPLFLGEGSDNLGMALKETKHKRKGSRKEEDKSSNRYSTAAYSGVPVLGRLFSLYEFPLAVGTWKTRDTQERVLDKAASFPELTCRGLSMALSLRDLENSRLHSKLGCPPWAPALGLYTNVDFCSLLFSKLVIN